MMTLFATLLLAAEIVVPVTEVEERPDTRKSVFPGRVVAVARVDVVPQVSGEILEVCFTNGAVVRTGDVLYRIDSVRYAAAVKNAEAKVAECSADARYASHSYERHQRLNDSRAVSLDAIDTALSRRDSTKAAYAAAEADLAAARDDLKHCTIVAPITGKVGSTEKTAGNYVLKGGDPLVSIVQSRPIRVRFSISSREFLDRFDGRNRRLREESVVMLTLANGMVYDEKGVVEYCDNEADEETDTIQVFALFPNDGRRLKAGGTVSVALTSKGGLPRPAIPPTAVLQDTQGPYVWVLDGASNAVRRAVIRGDLVGDRLFIEKGLAPGERIVADGAHRVHRGDRVKPAPSP